jgi:hypothetical protein
VPSWQTAFPRVIGIGRDALRENKSRIALDGEAADFCRQFDLRKAAGIELGTAHAEIAQAEDDIRLFRSTSVRSQTNPHSGMNSFTTGRKSGSFSVARSSYMSRPFRLKTQRRILIETNQEDGVMVVVVVVDLVVVAVVVVAVVTAMATIIVMEIMLLLMMIRLIWLIPGTDAAPYS